MPAGFRLVVKYQMDVNCTLVVINGSVVYGASWLGNNTFTNNQGTWNDNLYTEANTSSSVEFFT